MILTLECENHVVVQMLSFVWLFAAPWTAAHQASRSFTISQSLLRFMSIESVMLSNLLILCHLYLLLPSVFPSIRVFSNELALLIRWPKYCSFSISPSNEYSGLISFRTDWFDLFAVHETLKYFWVGPKIINLKSGSLFNRMSKRERFEILLIKILISYKERELCSSLIG